MSDIVIVDTDILIDVGRSDQTAVQRLEKEETGATLGISIITRMELIVGCRNKSELKALDKFLKRFEILHTDERIAEKAVELLQTYRLSHGLLIADSLIAATALIQKSPLLSKNQKDFARIPIFYKKINLDEVQMTTKEKIKQELDDLPDELLQQIHQFIKSVKRKNSNKKEVRSFKLGGQFDELNIRQRAYE